MKIEQFRYANDNLGYLLYHQGIGMAVDGGAVDSIIKFSQEKSIQIKYVSNTHAHHDHTPGNKPLLEKTGAQFIDCKTVQSDQNIGLGNETVLLFPTPGHTHDSITFYAQDFLVTGDTLFNGTVGNCFSGDLDGFFHSLKRLLNYPGNTKVYAGHDYVLESLDVARSIEPENKLIDAYQRRYDPDHVVSTLKDELEVNPYVRFNAQGILERLEAAGFQTESEYDRFHAMMEHY